MRPSYLALASFILSWAAIPVCAEGPQGGGGFRQGGFDPNAMFNMMSGGKDTLVRSSITDPQMLQRFDRMADRIGITNGQITREQFSGMMQQRGGRQGGDLAAAAGGGGGYPVAGAASAAAVEWVTRMHLRTAGSPASTRTAMASSIPTR